MDQWIGKLSMSGIRKYRNPPDEVCVFKKLRHSCKQQFTRSKKMIIIIILQILNYQNSFGRLFGLHFNLRNGERIPSIVVSHINRCWSEKKIKKTRKMGSC